MKTDEIVGLELLDQTFSGGRPTATGNHIMWDKLFIRVKPEGEVRHARLREALDWEIL